MKRPIEKVLGEIIKVDIDALKKLGHSDEDIEMALLKAADEKLLDLCRTCDNAMSDAGLGRFVDCKNCNVESLDTSIKELLAKLEGGAGDERD